jgi:hypothetical protein
MADILIQKLRKWQKNLAKERLWVLDEFQYNGIKFMRG